MNFIPNKHELKRVIFIQKREFPERREREREREMRRTRERRQKI